MALLSPACLLPQTKTNGIWFGRDIENLNAFGFGLVKKWRNLMPLVLVCRDVEKVNAFGFGLVFNRKLKKTRFSFNQNQTKTKQK